MIRTPFHLLIFLPCLGAQVLAAPATQAYSHGNPSAEEQYMLELVNRARMNPKAEGVFLATVKNPEIRYATDYFDVNLARLKADFAGYDPRPPLAFNPNLLASSRRHSRDMAKNNFQEHDGSDGSTVGSRIQDSGFPGGFLSEGIYANLVPYTLFAHAGLNIDWGNGPNGVQSGTGHRFNIMGQGGYSYREIGISIVSRKGADATRFGKLAITQDFGTRNVSPDFLVGVVYHDANQNRICDPGEGMPGIRVQPATGGWHAITSASGGYAIPFDSSPGASRVTFSGVGVGEGITRGFTMKGENVKLDLRIAAGPPTVSWGTVDKIATEKGDSASFRISRSGLTDRPLQVTLKIPTRTRRGIASASDYKLTTAAPASIKNQASRGKFIVTIPANQTEVEIKLKARRDSMSEPTEVANFKFAASKSYRVAKSRSVKIRIQR